MPFIYDADITVRSVIDSLDEHGLVEGESEVNTSLCRGFLKYDKSTGEITISYIEENDGAIVSSEISVLGNSVTLNKSGDTSYKLSFREGESVSEIYRVSGYAFDMTVYTKKIRNELTVEGGTLRLMYKMTIGGAERDAKMKISVSRVR